MDLALHLGSTVGGLSKVMTERELGDWAEYARTSLMPMHRVEWYLAQIAYWIATSMGGVKDVKITDFMLDTSEVGQEPDDDPEEVAAQARAFFGFNPSKD